MINRFTKHFSIVIYVRLASVLMLGVIAHTELAFGSGSIAYEHVFYQQTVTGRVTSSTGAVAGVTVSVKENPSVSTSTDDQGNFTISANRGQTLVFTAVGYNRIEQAVTGNVLSVILQESDQSLEEVVVVGYGVQRKESLTGAMQVVKGDELRDITNPSVENMLNGKVAGAFVSPGSGRPGSGGAVVIRGQATLNGTTSPLWVIDGVIVGSGAGDLNPDDIETMTVLKDAASTAIYGSQGANGVVVVTT